jgi:hypothetical protein
MTDYQNPAFRRLTWEETQQPYVDAEFAEQREPHVHDRPEWQVWAFFGNRKFEEATRRLHYQGERGGLYHYSDLRDGFEYSVPTFERVKAYRKEQRQAEVHNVASAKLWKFGWLLWGIALAVILFAMIVVYKLTQVNHQHVLDNMAVVWFAVFFVGGLGLVIGRSGSKRRARELPPHQMFYTDEELAEMQRRQNVKDAIAVAMVAGYAAHKYHEHSQERLAHLIAEEERGHGLYGSEWHQY